jgi:hypothetical protein
MKPEPLFTVFPATNWRISTSPYWNKGFKQIVEFKAYRSDRGYLPQEVFNAMKWHEILSKNHYCQIEWQKEDGTWHLTYNWPIYRLKECKKIILPKYNP